MTVNAVTVRDWGVWEEGKEVLQRYLFDEGSKAILDKYSQVGVLFLTDDDSGWCWWMVQEQGTPTVCSLQ